MNTSSSTGDPRFPPAYSAIRLTTCQAPNSDYLLRVVSDYLAEQTGLPINFDVRADWPERYAELERGTMHAAWICGAPYVRLRGRGIAVELLAAPVWKGDRYQDRPVYFSDVLVREDSPFTRFEDLRGARFAVNEPGSLSGYECVRGELARRGEPGPFFGAVFASGAHQNSLALILSGEVDAAAIDTTVLEEEIRRQPGLAARLRAIHTIGPAPMPPVVAAAALSPKTRTLLRDALVSMHTTAHGAQILAGLPVARFAAISDADYEPLRALLARAEQVSL